MSYPERRKKILELIQDHTERTVKDISDNLKISEVTVRRDLLKMESEGLLIRTHGGAMLREDIPLISFKNKILVEEEIKNEIAKRASQEVQEGDTLFMDCGTTVFFMCSYLKKFKNLKIITNSLPILSEFLDIKGIEINLAGGELDKERKAMHGQKTLEHLNSYHADKVFFGIDGISKDFELSSHSEKESSISKAMIENSDQAFLLADALKFEKNAYLKIDKIEKSIAWITNFVPDKGQIEKLREKRISLIGI